MKESLVVKACIDWLWANGCYVWRNNTGAYKPENGSRFIRYGLTGSADIIGLTRGGRFVAVECKSDKGKLSEHQKRFGERIIEKGGIYIVARTTDDLEAHKAEFATL